jgi:hypothetical protein
MANKIRKMSFSALTWEYRGVVRGDFWGNVKHKFVWLVF